MIREHAMNSEWFGQPVGIVDDPSFFSLDRDRRAAELARFAWTEARLPAVTPVADAALLDSGFAWVDSQVQFRIPLSRVPVTPSAELLEVVHGTSVDFRGDFSSCRTFEHERYLALGITQTRLDARFHLWAERLLGAAPSTSLELRFDGRTQGWFLAEENNGSVSLALAMGHREATVSGLLLYERALREFARLGGRVGHAGFSVKNTTVHNIYARLGAVFVAPVQCYLTLGTSS